MRRTAEDPKKAAALARQVGVDFGASMTVALAYIGDRLGIFRTMSEGERMTSVEIAERSHLDERYVREWASTMAAAGYVDYDPVDKTFRMNAEQARVLAREDNTFYTAGAFQYAVTCYRQIPRLMEAFQRGGGVPFAAFGPDIVEAIERLFHVGYETWVAREWIPAVPDVHERLIVGCEAAEVGCGAGQCLVPVASAYPSSRFVGYDVDPYSIERAREKAVRAGVADRVSFERVAAEDLPSDARLDCVMAFNCIHDMARPRAALAAIRRVLKPDGVLLWSEADASDDLEENLNPVGRALYGASTMHCMTVSLADQGEGLGVVIGKNKARAMAEEAGFGNFERLDIKNPYHQVFLARR